MNPETPEELPEAPLAYENPNFLNSPDGRVLRILAEYQEPMARFRRERIQDTVVFFGSARFRALDVTSTELELLANTGSTEPAPLMFTAVPSGAVYGPSTDPRGGFVPVSTARRVLASRAEKK